MPTGPTKNLSFLRYQVSIWVFFEKISCFADSFPCPWIWVFCFPECVSNYELGLFPKGWWTDLIDFGSSGENRGRKCWNSWSRSHRRHLLRAGGVQTRRGRGWLELGSSSAATGVVVAATVEHHPNFAALTSDLLCRGTFRLSNKVDGWADPSVEPMVVWAIRACLVDFHGEIAGRMDYVSFFLSLSKP